MIPYYIDIYEVNYCTVANCKEREGFVEMLLVDKDNKEIAQVYVNIGTDLGN